MMGAQSQHQLPLQQHLPALQQGWTSAQQQQYWQLPGVQGVQKQGFFAAQQQQSQQRESLQQQQQALRGGQSQGFPSAQQRQSQQRQHQHGLQSQGWPAAQQQQRQQACAGHSDGGLNIRRRPALPGRPKPVQGPAVPTVAAASAPAGSNEEQAEEADGGFGDGLEEQSYTAVSTTDLEALGLRRHPDAIAECASLRYAAGKARIESAEAASLATRFCFRIELLQASPGAYRRRESPRRLFVAALPWPPPS